MLLSRVQVSSPSVPNKISRQPWRKRNPGSPLVSALLVTDGELPPGVRHDGVERAKLAEMRLNSNPCKPRRGRLNTRHGSKQTKDRMGAPGVAVRAWIAGSFSEGGESLG